MIEPLGRKTIKTVNAPVDWIFIEGQSHRNIRELPAVEFFKAIRDGVDPRSTPYALDLLRFFDEGLGERAQQAGEDRLKTLENISGKKDALTERLPAKINADGRFELLDGHHRASQAIVDGVTSIELDVKYASPLWIDLCNRLQGIYGSKKLYQRVEHPWFDDWEVARNDDRGRRIINTLNGLGVPKRNCVDIGCCTGRICRLMEQSGFNVYGVDRDENVIAVADHLNMVTGSHVNFTIAGDIERVVTGCGMGSTNVVICLSVLHHFMWEGDEPGYENALRLMVGNSKILFFDHVNDEDTSLIKTMGIPIDAQDLCEWVREKIPGASIKVIGTFDERPMFACSSRIEI
jgi:SAM-dependent methyltransferase